MYGFSWKLWYCYISLISLLLLLLVRCPSQYIANVFFYLVLCCDSWFSFTNIFCFLKVYVAKYENKWVRVQCQSEMSTMSGYKVRFGTKSNHIIFFIFYNALSYELQRWLALRFWEWYFNAIFKLFLFHFVC